MKSCQTAILILGAFVLVSGVTVADTIDFGPANEPCSAPDWNDEKLQAACNLYCTLNDCETSHYDATSVLGFLLKLNDGTLGLFSEPEPVDDGGAVFKPNQPVYRAKAPALAEKR